MQSAPLAHRTYVIGSFERRVTIYSQQVRALNLIYALEASGRIKGADHVVVIGGGIAGLTAATAAARLGFDVTLLEKTARLLGMQRGCLHRYLHPHIYDWPEEGATEDDANLPVLTWTANPADMVARNILDSFNRGVEREKIRVWYNVKNAVRSLVFSWRGCQETNDLMAMEPEAPSGKNCAAIVVAVGFGIEGPPPFAPNTDGSYWTSDPLQGHTARPGRLHYLVSGCGDGGLIDFLRLCLEDFEHRTLADDFVQSRCEPDEFRQLKEQLLEIEVSARHLGTDAAASAMLQEQYGRLHVPMAIDEAIRRRLRPDTIVTLTGLEASPLTLHSSILNRFLVSRLIQPIHPAGMQYVPGPVEVVRTGEMYAGRLRDGTPVGFYDRVVVRHGPTKCIQELLGDGAAAHLRDLAQLDMTRDRLWPKGYFDLDAKGRAALRTSFSGTGLAPDDAERLVAKMGNGWRVTDDSMHIALSGLQGTEIPLRVGAPTFDKRVDELKAQKYDNAAHNERVGRWLSPFEGVPEAKQYLLENLEHEARKGIMVSHACKIGLAEVDWTSLAGNNDQPPLVVRPLNHLVTQSFNRRLAESRIIQLRSAEIIWRRCVEHFAMPPTSRMACPSQLFVELALVTLDEDVPITGKDSKNSVYAKRNEAVPGRTGKEPLLTCGPERGPDWSKILYGPAGNAYLDVKTSIADALTIEYRIQLPWTSTNPLREVDGPVLRCTAEPEIQMHSLAIQCFHLNSALLGICRLPVTTRQLEEHLHKLRTVDPKWLGGMNYEDVHFISVKDSDEIEQYVNKQENTRRWHGTALARLRALVDRDVQRVLARSPA